jgi:hypothetical protein
MNLMLENFNRERGRQESPTWKISISSSGSADVITTPLLWNHLTTVHAASTQQRKVGNAVLGSCRCSFGALGGS